MNGIIHRLVRISVKGRKFLIRPLLRSAVLIRHTTHSKGRFRLAWLREGNTVGDPEVMARSGLLELVPNWPYLGTNGQSVKMIIKPLVGDC